MSRFGRSIREQGRVDQISGLTAPTESEIPAHSDCTNCSLCSSVVGVDAVGCDDCNGWDHPSTQCTGLSKTALKCIKEDGGDAIRYVCPKCRCRFAQPNSSVSYDKETFGQLFEMIKSLAESLATLTNQIANITRSIQNPNNPSQVHPENFVSPESVFVQFQEYED